MNSKIYPIVFVFLGMMLHSCTMEKRVYNRGFHMDWFSAAPAKKETQKQHSNLASKNASSIDFDKPFKIKESKILLEETEEFAAEMPLVVNRNRTKPQKHLGVMKWTEIQDTVKCDLMILRNGDEVDVKVIEVGEELVKYKMCNNLEGPIFTKSVSKIFMLKYINGTKTVFETQPETTIIKSPPTEETSVDDDWGKTVPAAAVVSLLSGVIGFFMFGFVFGLLAIVLGLVGISMVANNPDKYEGRGAAIIGLILGFANLFLLLVLLSY